MALGYLMEGENRKRMKLLGFVTFTLLRWDLHLQPFSLFLQLGRFVCASNWMRPGDSISCLVFLQAEKEEMG